MEEQAKQILSKYYQHFQEMQWDLFANYLHDDFLYFTDKCIFLNKEAFVRNLIQKQWEQTSHEIIFLPMPRSTQDNSSICLRYKIKFEGKYEGQQMSLNALETMIFIREQEDWKIIHCHSSND